MSAGRRPLTTCAIRTGWDGWSLAKDAAAVQTVRFGPELEESPDSAVAFGRRKVDACRKAGRRKPTDANPTPRVGSSCKRAIETSRSGNGAGGTR